LKEGVLRKATAMADSRAPDGGIVVPRISDVLRTPEDLEKISAFKADFSRKKADVDARLREGLKEHLETTQLGMSTLVEGQKLVGQIKEEMKSIHDLCEQAQAIRKDFPQIDYLARVHRNFEATKAMQSGLASFNDDVAAVEQLLLEDDKDIENQPNLLEAHMRLTKLRDFRDEAMDQIKKAKDTSLETTLMDWFQGLDTVIEIFDEHVGGICIDLINLVQRDNTSACELCKRPRKTTKILSANSLHLPLVQRPFEDTRRSSFRLLKELPALNSKQLGKRFWMIHRNWTSMSDGFSMISLHASKACKASFPRSGRSSGHMSTSIISRCTIFYFRSSIPTTFDHRICWPLSTISTSTTRR
jgi:hypothetical protein